MVAKSKKASAPKQPAAAPEVATEVAAAPTAELIEPAVAKPVAAKSPVEKTTVDKAAVEEPTVAAAFFGYTGLPGFAEADVAAIARANAALVKGIEAMGQEVAGLAQQNMTQAVDAARALVGVRTIADLVAINRNLAQATLDSVVAKSARLSEIGIRVASEALVPLNEQVAVVFGRFTRPVL
jgi:hypothetical protein